MEEKFFPVPNHASHSEDIWVCECTACGQF